MNNKGVPLLDFYKNRRVFVTGHTGFKGAWLCHVLSAAGAEVTGYALEPNTDPNLYGLCGLSRRMNSVIADIRDSGRLADAVKQARPEIVFHLAAQPLVLQSYARPLYTYEVNVIGTACLLDCLRRIPGVKSILNVTTDKVYRNDEQGRPFSEGEPLDGFDPYSNSKSCSELVTHTYRRCFFEKNGVAVSTARAGNVIGGGDFAPNRIVPDCVRAAAAKQPVKVRNPHSVRPYQHVLEPIFAYLLIARAQYEDPGLSGSYNIGPGYEDCIDTGMLAGLFCTAWGPGQQWQTENADAPHEANFLRLDCTLARTKFGWVPTWCVADAVARTVEWTKIWLQGGDIEREMTRQCEIYLDTKEGLI